MLYKKVKLLSQGYRLKQTKSLKSVLSVQTAKYRATNRKGNLTIE